MEDKNVSEALKTNEILRMLRFFIERWGGNLIDLCRENKSITPETIKEYLKELVDKEIKGFDEVLDRFSKYECKFNKCPYQNLELDEFEKILNDKYEYVPFFNFKELIKEIKKENKEIQKEYGLEIKEKYVCGYVSDKVRYDESLMDEIKNYKQLIWNAYTDRINSCADYFGVDHVLCGLCDLNFNKYRFCDEGFNIVDIYYEGFKSKYLTWKQGKYDVYRKDTKDIVEEEYKEIKFILEMREMLEKTKVMDRDGIFKKCCDISKKFNETIYSKDLEDIDVEEDDEISIHFRKLENMFYGKINNKQEIDYLKEIDYFKGFIEFLKYSAAEERVEQFINELINLTEEEYYPGMFIKKFKDLIHKKYKVISMLEQLEIDLDELLDYIEAEDQYSFSTKYKSRMFVLGQNENYGLIAKVCEYLKKDYKAVANKWSRLTIFYYYHFILFKDLLSKYKITFFEKLNEILENRIKGIDNVRKIILFIGNLKKKDITKEDVENLIKKIGDNISKESIEKLKEFYKIDQKGEKESDKTNQKSKKEPDKTNQKSKKEPDKTNQKAEEKFDKIFFDRILDLAGSFKKENVLDFNQADFFKMLEKLIEDFFGYKKSMGETRETLSTISNISVDANLSIHISDKDKEEILEKFKNITTKDILEKFSYNLKELKYIYSKEFIKKIIYLIDFCKNKDEFSDIFKSLVENVHTLIVKDNNNGNTSQKCIESFFKEIEDMKYNKLFEFLKKDKCEKEKKEKKIEDEHISSVDFYSDYFGLNKEE